MSGTPLQEVYTRFSSKIDEDLTGKESLIYEYLLSAKSKIYKIITHSLEFILDTPISPATVSYDGSFITILDQDEIELLALQMKYESYARYEAYLLALRLRVGTKDFNSLPNKKQELDGIQNSKRLLKIEIDDLKQQFNDYKYD